MVRTRVWTSVYVKGAIYLPTIFGDCATVGVKSDAAGAFIVSMELLLPEDQRFEFANGGVATQVLRQSIVIDARETPGVAPATLYLMHGR